MMSKRKQIRRRMWLCLLVAVTLIVVCAPLSVGIGAKFVYMVAPTSDPIFGTSGRRLQNMLNSAAGENEIFQTVVKYSPTPTKSPVLSLSNALSVITVAGLVAGGLLIVLFFAYLNRLGEAKRNSDNRALEEDYDEDRRQARRSLRGSDKSYDVFISHASEDKNDFVRPLADGLRSRGLEVWYDEFTLKIGDSLRRSIDKGLSQSSYGIVVLSKSFLSKDWPQYELDGLVTKEIGRGKFILPIWHKITKEEVISYSPSIADRVAINTALLTTSEIANEIAEVILDGET